MDESLKEKVLNDNANSVIDIWSDGYKAGFEANHASNSYSVASLNDCSEEDMKLFDKQRKERGFDDSELWAFSETVSKFLVPRLEAILASKDHYSNTYECTAEEYDQDLSDMIEGFKFASKPITDWCDEYQVIKRRQILDAENRAIDLFRKHFFKLCAFND